LRQVEVRALILTDVRSEKERRETRLPVEALAAGIRSERTQICQLEADYELVLTGEKK